MNKLSIILLVLIFGTSVVKAQDDDSEKIEKLKKAWVNAASSEDVDAFMKLVSNEAVFFKPGEPTRGTESIKALYESYFGAYDLEIKATINELEVFEDKAYVWCFVKGTRKLKTGGELEDVAYNNLWILKKEDNQWKFWRVMFITAIES